MTSADILTDGYGRLNTIVHSVLDDVETAELTSRVDPEANTIAWLVWHLSRGEDQTIASSSGQAQVWEQWRDRFDLPFSDSSTGYGHSTEDVGAVTSSAELLLGYADAVHESAITFLATVTDAALAEIVDTRWDPPVTLAVRLVSVLSDCLQHAGQASYVLGVSRRLN